MVALSDLSFQSSWPSEPGAKIFDWNTPEAALGGAVTTRSGHRDVEGRSATSERNRAEAAPAEVEAQGTKACGSEEAKDHGTSPAQKPGVDRS